MTFSNTVGSGDQVDVNASIDNNIKNISCSIRVSILYEVKGVFELNFDILWYTPLRLLNIEKRYILNLDQISYIYFSRLNAVLTLCCL